MSRRSLVAGATFFGAAMAAMGDVAKVQDAGSESTSNVAIALPVGAAKSREEQIRAVKPHAPCARDPRWSQNTRPSPRWISKAV